MVKQLRGGGSKIFLNFFVYSKMIFIIRKVKNDKNDPDFYPPSPKKLEIRDLKGKTEFCSTKWDKVSQGQFVHGQSETNA